MAPVRTRPLKCWTCGVVGHFSANCQRRRCWHCGGAGHIRRTCPHRGKNPQRQTSQDKIRPQGQRGRAEGRYHPVPIPNREPPRREMGPRRNKETPWLAPASRWSRGAANRERFKDRREARVYQVLKEGSDFTCSVLLGGRKVRALVDTGASVSLINSKTYRRLGRKEKLRPVDLYLSQADSSRMRIEGITWLPFQLARTRGDMKVYVALDLCGELILGSDWLKQNKAQIRFDPATLTLERGRDTTRRR